MVNSECCTKVQSQRLSASFSFDYELISEFYKYNVTIDHLGTIKIKKADEELNLDKNKKYRKKKKRPISKIPIFSIKNDKEEGIYKFENGKYIKLENQQKIQQLTAAKRIGWFSVN